VTGRTRVQAMRLAAMVLAACGGAAAPAPMTTTPHDGHHGHHGDHDGHHGDHGAAHRFDDAAPWATGFDAPDRHARPGTSGHNRVAHDAILAASRNAVLAETAHKLNLRIQNLRFRSNLDIGKWNAAIKEHQQMVELLRKRDAEGLARLMREHLSRKAAAVLAMLS